MTAYGIEWEGGTDPNAVARLQTGSTLNIPADAAAIAAFDTYAPWSGIERCNLWDTGLVTASYGARCYTDEDVDIMGQCMVKIPKFWYSVDITGAPHIRYYISTTGTETTIPNHNAVGYIAWSVHPAFIRDGVTKNQIYLGAFEAYLNTSVLESKVGVQPTTSQSLAQFRTAAQTHGITAGVGWGIQDYLATMAVQLLYLIEYATFESQGADALGPGVTQLAGHGAAHNAASLTGHTGSLQTDLGNASGSVGPYYNEHTAGETPPGTYVYSSSYRGIENIFGNVLTALDGVKLNTNVVWIADHDFNSVDAPTNPPYVNSTVTWGLGAATGPISAFDYSGSLYKYAFVPETTTGTNIALYVPDSNIQASTTTTIPLSGGWYKSGWFGGMFAWDANFFTPPLTYGGYYGVGTRLMYFG